MSEEILITGAAGFVGFSLARAMLEDGQPILGIDNLNNYYDCQLKEDRLKILLKYPHFRFEKVDISQKGNILQVFQDLQPKKVIHLAAQAGVRYSLENPDSYIQSNIIGFYNILEACRFYPVDHLIYASSSSVYGNNPKLPFAESDQVDQPTSLYAASKKANEVMAYSYSHLYQIPMTGLRFFTVYGPYGRPDMAYYSFTDKYFARDPIHIYNNGDPNQDPYRDFTYIDDIVQGIQSIIDLRPNPDANQASYRLLNIGNSKPVKLTDFIQALERALTLVLGRPVEFNKIYVPPKEGDVRGTYASNRKLENLTAFKPTTSLDRGLLKFAQWYVEYHQLPAKLDIKIAYSPLIVNVNLSNYALAKRH